MALLTFSNPTKAAPTTCPAVASAPGGDTIAYTGSKTAFLSFINGASGSVTVTIPGQAKSLTAGKYGPGTFTESDIVAVVAAGAKMVIPLTPDIIAGYVDGSNLIHINYTSGDVLLLVQTFLF